MSAGSHAIWRIGTDTPDYTAEDMRGIGAKMSGGRWSRQGTAVVYAASTQALACLETIVHLNAGALPLNRYLVRIDIPGAVWNARQSLLLPQAPIGWDCKTAGKVSLDYGDQWVLNALSCILEVPSVIVPDESIFLVNPAHADAVKIVATKVRLWTYDARLRLP